MYLVIRYLFILVYVAIALNVSSADTVFIDQSQKEINISKYISYLMDVDNKLTIDTLLNYSQEYYFIKNKNAKLNFEFSESTIWLQFIVKNNSDEFLYYILTVNNPDLNYINFYEVNNDSISRQVNTGELCNISLRDIPNRNFLFKVDLQPKKTYKYYVSVNSGGGPLIIPIFLKDQESFHISDKRTELIYWLIYGILIFIILFNLYLYRSTKDKVNLYYALYVFFATAFFLYYDGYFSYINPSIFLSKIKFLYPGLYTVFLLSFTQAFIDSRRQFPTVNKYLGAFKILSVTVALSNCLPYPYSLIAEIGLPIIILISLITIIVFAFNYFSKDYTPSQFFFIAYLFMFSGIVIHELKEFNVVLPGFFVDNSIKFGLTIECILLTIAVLERFRIIQENAKKTIELSYDRIDLQNRELEIINTELEKLSIVASETDNCVAIYDNQGRLEWCNTGFERFYESKQDELIKEGNDHLEQIVKNKDITSLFRKCLDEKTPVIFESRVITKTKKKKWVQTTLSPYVKGGSIQKVIAVDSDITNLKEYQRELKISKNKAEESDRLKTIFLGNMSHEIRTPLNGILGFSELLQRQDLSPERKENYLKMIMSNGDQLIRIIDDIVDISLIESNQLKIKAEDLSLNHLIDETCDFFEIYKSTVDKQHIAIIKELKIDKEHDIVHIDKHRLKQVLTNLMRNALKFTVEGTVILKCATQGEHVLFCVEDTGIGIDPTKKNIVFERFRQGEESLSRRFGGTGLGLSISKGILDMMGGTIWIDSSYTDGLRICFSIPSVSVQTINLDDTSNAGDKQKDKIRHKRILVVEDHDNSFDYLVELLSPFDPAVSRAHNGKQAVELAKQNVFDIVLMDINLPELDGMAATREIRKFDQKVPIIAQTAYAMESEKETILASGCNDIINKPISSSLFYSILASHL